MKRLLCCAAAAALLAAALPLKAEGLCRGRITNPVTDVCWSCIFPIRVAGARLSANGVTDPTTDAPAVCTCGAGAGLRVGLNMSFWEPLRTVEIVRHPWCFPTLGGVAFTGMQAPAHGRSSSRGSVGEEGGRHTAFYEAHWFHTPWLFVLEALMDTVCLEQSPWDLAYLTELDPLWNDTLAAFVVAPESAIFATPAAVAACAADCAAATMGSPRPELFWCAGCQGSLYPLSGWMAQMTSPLQAWHLLAARMSVKLAREGVLWAAYGKAGQCGPYFQPIPRKDVWRTQLVHPKPQASGSSCCHALGAATQLWGAGRTPPVTGEDGAILMWRLRDCCQGAGLFR